VVDACSEVDDHEGVGYEGKAVDDGFGGAALDGVEVVLCGGLVLRMKMKDRGGERGRASTLSAAMKRSKS